MQRLHDWAILKIKRLYSPVGNEGWLNIHLWSVINQAFRLGNENKKEHAIEFCEWLTQHGHNLTDHMGMYEQRYNEWINSNKQHD